MGESIGKKNRYRDDWTVWKYENAAFIDKYSSVKYGSNPKLYNKRLKEYMRRYNLGEGAKVSNLVTIERNHYLEGSIRVGKNILLSKNAYIDYSGELIIHDNVAIANGVIIETHAHQIDKGGKALPTRLEIGDNTRIYTRAYVADTCHFIGRGARIGAGSYVRKDIPPYAVAIGNPAKVVGFVMTPEDVEGVEENYPENERISMDQYRKDYEKYFKGRIKDIRKYVNN